MPGMAPAQKLKKGRVLVGYVNTAPVVTITGTPTSPSVGVATPGYTATAVDAEQGDISAGLTWIGRLTIATQGRQEVDFGATAGLSDPTGLAGDTSGMAFASIATAPPGSTVVGGLPADTYDFDIDIDGGGVVSIPITTSGGEDLDAIAALMDTAVGAPGSVVYVTGSGWFQLSSATLGTGSSAFLVGGTGGAPGGDLFAAISAAMTLPVSPGIPVPVPGTSTTYTATVTIDGGTPQAISIVGDDALVFSELITELNADTTGALWSITGGNLECESTLSGSGSSVVISDTDLFSSILNFSAISAPVAGVDETTGTVGSGASPSISLPTIGAQTIRAEVTDAASALGFDTAVVTTVP